ncbi:unnamed protein product [Closterium sp. Yama58-4]|nr:unnamed protein product [Closterium sp. Yama58-4]
MSMKGPMSPLSLRATELEDRPPEWMALIAPSSSAGPAPPLPSASSSNGGAGGGLKPRRVRVLPVSHPSHADIYDSGSPGGTGGFIGSNCWAAFWRVVHYLFPCTKWMAAYSLRDDLVADLIAGISVGVMLVPQLAVGPVAIVSILTFDGLRKVVAEKLRDSAVAAGLAAAAGGFSPTAGLAVAGGLGSTAVAGGVVGGIELPAGTVMGEFQPSRSLLEFRTSVGGSSSSGSGFPFPVSTAARQLSSMGMGWLVRFLSHSVVSGFTSGAALLVCVSVAKDILGFSMPGQTTFAAALSHIIKQIMAGKAHWEPMALGGGALLLLLLMKEAGKSWKSLQVLRCAGPFTSIPSLSTAFPWEYFPNLLPTALVITGVAILESCGIAKALAARNGYAINTLLFCPFPTSHPNFPSTAALVITGVAILESCGIAKALAARNGYAIDANQELFGLGMANVIGSFFSSFPTTGSFSRSAVNNEVGARTALSGLIMALMVVATLLFLTPAFRDVPQCVLAAVVVNAVHGLVDLQEPLFLWRVEKKDLVLWLCAFLGTLLLGLETGVLISVALSLVFVIHESANPHMAVLGRLPGTTVYRNVKQYRDAYTYRGVVILRIDSPIYFANVDYIKERLRKYELQRVAWWKDGSSGSSGGRLAGSNGHAVMDLRFLILEMSPVTYIDSTAVHALKELYNEYKARDIQLCFSNPSPKVMLTMARAGFPDLIGRQWYFVRIHDAVQVCLALLEDTEITIETPSRYQRADSTAARAAASQAGGSRQQQQPQGGPQVSLQVSPTPGLTLSPHLSASFVNLAQAAQRASSSNSEAFRDSDAMDRGSAAADPFRIEISYDDLFPHIVYLNDLRHDPDKVKDGSAAAGDSGLVSKWRMKDRMKTSSVAIVLCLNIGVDPPDVIKISPCARVECWIDPFSMNAQKALDTIGKNLQAQYERWQPKARYKVQLDPTVEEVKKLCLTCRRNAKAERVLFHYNGHGVPKPTGNGEIWVFNKTYTQYIPLSVYELDSWLATPSIYVFDCSAAGMIINAFVERPDWALAAPSSPLASPTAASREAATATAAAAAGMRDRILLAACGPEEILPQPPDLPADLFTACLTTPIKIALRWFCTRSLLRDSLDPEMVERIPGRQSERKTALGELNWIFTAVTDTIAWNTLPTHLFQRLFRQDLLVASLFRNFLLAERVMRASGCTPVSYPRLPPTHQHHLW